MLALLNVNVHRAAAKIIVSKCSAARKSLCNLLLHRGLMSGSIVIPSILLSPRVVARPAEITQAKCEKVWFISFRPDSGDGHRASSVISPSKTRLFRIGDHGCSVLSG